MTTFTLRFQLAFLLALGGLSALVRAAVQAPIVYERDAILPRSLAIYDVDGDGRNEIVLMNGQSDGLLVLRHASDGAILPPAQLPLQGYFSTFAFADFDGDKYADVALLDMIQKNVQIQLGVGRSEPKRAISLDCGLPVSLVCMDVNGDSKLDVVVGCSNPIGVYVWLGDGRGGFQSRVFSSSIMTPYHICAADVNADGRLDLVIGSSADRKVGIMLGNGDGSFSMSDRVAVESGVRSLTTFRGDRKSMPRVASVGMLGERDLTVITPSRGSEKPISAVAISTNQVGTSGLASGDIDGDGLDDLACSSMGSNSVFVIHGRRDGSLRDTSIINTEVAASELVVGDIDHDGTIDLVMFGHNRNDEYCVSVSFGRKGGARAERTVVCEGDGASRKK